MSSYEICLKTAGYYYYYYYSIKLGISGFLDGKTSSMMSVLILEANMQSIAKVYQH